MITTHALAGLLFQMDDIEVSNFDDLYQEETIDTDKLKWLIFMSRFGKGTPNLDWCSNPPMKKIAVIKIK